MHIRPIVIPVIAMLLMGSLAAPAVAQIKAAPTKQPAKAAPNPSEAPPPFKEVALSEKQIEGALTAQKDFDAIAATLPQKPSAKPDPKIAAQFEDAAKKNGFASYAEYNDVLATIGVVMGGFDPQSKTYVGPEAVMRQQIAAIEADKKMPAKNKKAALDEMNAMLKSPPPAVQNKGNIDLAAKYYDRLAAAMSKDAGPAPPSAPPPRAKR